MKSVFGYDLLEEAAHNLGHKCGLMCVFTTMVAVCQLLPHGQRLGRKQVGEPGFTRYLDHHPALFFEDGLPEPEILSAACVETLHRLLLRGDRVGGNANHQGLLDATLFQGANIRLEVFVPTSIALEEGHFVDVDVRHTLGLIS